jgi:hypothetical protein
MIKPEIKRLVTVRFNELTSDGTFSLTQFAEEQLAAKGLPLGDGNKVVKNALWKILQGFESHPEKMPRPEDLLDAAAFRAYFQALMISEVEAMAPRDPLGQIKANARMLIWQLRPLSSAGFGLNRESVDWLEGYIEQLRQKGQLSDTDRRERLAGVFGSFLGECIIECHGGNWVQREGAWCVAFDDKNAAFPFAKVVKQMENGVGDGIGGFFRAVPVVFAGCPRKAPELPAAAPQNPPPAVAPAVPHPAMEYTPAIKSANPKWKLQVGRHTAVMFDNIESTGSIQYKYMIGVYDENRQAVFYVTSEVNRVAKRHGGGSHFLCIFNGGSHLNKGGSDDWADEEKFTEKAMEIIMEKFAAGVSAPAPSPPPSLLAGVLQDQFMAYFGDQEDEAAIAELREDVKRFPGTRHYFHDGIIQYLNDPGLDCVHLVQNCANRNVHGSQEEARAWLTALFTQLFGGPVPLINKDGSRQPD